MLGLAAFKGVVFCLFAGIIFECAEKLKGKGKRPKGEKGQGQQNFVSWPDEQLSVSINELFWGG